MKDLVNISKKSWLGNTPSNWEILRVKNLFEISKEKNDGEELPVLSLTQKGIKIRDISDNEGQIAATYENYTRIRKDDIVFNPMDLCTGAVDLSIFDGVISLAYTTIREKKKNESFLKYYKYFFQWHYLHEIFFPFGQGVSVDHRWTLKDDILMNFPVLVPPLETQKNITDFLDEKTKVIDELVTKKEKMIELLREKRAALIAHAVTKGLDPKAKMKPSGIDWLGDIPDSWDVKKIAFLFNFPNEKVSDKDFEPLSVTYNGVEKQVEDALKTDNGDNRKLLKKGDIAFNGRSDRRGACGVSEYTGSISVVYHVLRVKSPKIFVKYYHHLFRNDIFSQEFYKWGRGIHNDMWSTKIMEMKKIQVPLPPLKEQKKIAEYLDAEIFKIDNYNTYIKIQIEQLKEFRSSLIYSAVTGKIKL